MFVFKHICSWKYHWKYKRIFIYKIRA